PCRERRGGTPDRNRLRRCLERRSCAPGRLIGPSLCCTSWRGLPNEFYSQSVAGQAINIAARRRARDPDKGVSYAVTATAASGRAVVDDASRASGVETDGSLATNKTEHSARSSASAGTRPKNSCSPGRGLTPITRRLWSPTFSWRRIVSCGALLRRRAPFTSTP